MGLQTTRPRALAASMHTVMCKYLRIAQAGPTMHSAEAC